MVGIIAGQSIGEVSTQMSVSYDTQHKILIKHKQTGHVDFTSVIVGNFIDELMKQYPQYTFDTGYENSYETLLDNLDTEYYIQSVDEKETTKWTKLSHVSKHPVNGQMIRVHTKSGRMVETTPSHSHLIRNQHKVTAISGSKLTEGMRIPVCTSIQNAYTKEYMTFHIHNNEVRIPLGIEFGWFIGAYLAEGNLNYNEISITNISDIYIQKVKLVANMFGCECRVAKSQGQYGPSITTKFVCSELAQLLRNTCGNGSYEKRIPDFAFIAPNDFQSALFQGYFDGDGNFQCDEHHHQLRCCSRSKQLT
jgi:DNA-directed RNA polymerase subunit A"